jgi:hypothetical protein
MEANSQPLASGTALRELRREIESRAQAMNAEHLLPRSDGKWNVAQILEHLYLTYTGTIRGLNGVVEAGKPLARPRTMKDGVRTFVVTGLGYIPTGRKSPPVAMPRSLDVEIVRAQIGAQLAALENLLNDCARQFGRRTRILDHPVLGPLTAAEWGKFHVAHGKHHLKQVAERWSAPR